MLDPFTTGKSGRPRVPHEKEEAVYILADAGKKPAEIAQTVGLGIAKVYEFLRWRRTAQNNLGAFPTTDYAP